MLVIGGLAAGFVSDYELSDIETSAQSDNVKQMRWNHKFNNEEEPLPQAEVADGAPIAVESRVYVWRYYWEGISESFSSFLFGHADRPERSLMPSAHNYLLDLIYNYGFLSAIPFIYLITVTMRRMGVVWKNGHVRPDLLALAGLVLLLVLGGNTLTVGLRQPYAGIFTFFIWGLLLGRLGLLGMDRGGAKAD
jgi:hypothetical protein